MFWSLFGALGDADEEIQPQKPVQHQTDDASETKAEAAPANPAAPHILPAIPLARRPASQQQPPEPTVVPSQAPPPVIPIAEPRVASPPAAGTAEPTASPVEPIPIRKPAAAPEPIPIRQPSQPATGAPAEPARSAPHAPTPASPAQTPPGAPVLGTFQAQKSKYYANVVVDPVSGTHYDTDTGKPLEAASPSRADVFSQEHAAATARQIGQGVAALVGLVILGAALTRSVPQLYLWWLGIIVLVAGALMPIMHVAPFGEDDSSDVPIAIGLFLVLGPVVGTVVYAVISMMRSSINPALLGIGIIYIVVRVPIDAVAGNGALALLGSLMPFTHPLPDETWGAHLVCMYLVFAGMIGWYGAGMFHNLNE